MNTPYMHICPDEQEAKNTGLGCDCLETKLDFPIFSDEDFQFNTIADYKNPQKWKDAIAAKKLAPLFKAYALADASTQDKYFEVGKFRERTEKGIEKITFEFMLSDNAYAILKS